jgi:group I intron endonuclease
MIFYTVYKTTNTINNKVYIGKHTTSNSKDNYLGSGVSIKRAIEKYGSAAFIKDILFCAFTEDDAFWFESLIVDEHFVLRKDTYNMSIGGKGTTKGKLHPRYNKPLTEEHKLRLKEVNLGAKRKPFSEKAKSNMSKGQKNKKYSEETKEKCRKRMSGANNHMFGKKTSDETKSKQSLAKQKFIYEIESPEGIISTTRSIESYCRDHQINSGNMYGPRKCSSGHRIISKTAIDKIKS